MNFQNSDFTANVGDYNVVDTSGGNVICSLPDTSEWGDDNNCYLCVSPSGSLNNLTINAYEAQTINGESSITINAESSVQYLTLVMGSGNWYTF